MGYINKVTGTDNTTAVIASGLYGTCSTGASTVKKEVTCSDFDALQTGVTIKVKFTNSNTAANPTMDVNGTGAKSIYKYGTTVPGKTAVTSWYAGAVMSFTYDGSSWMMNDFTSEDSNSNTWRAIQVNGTQLLGTGTGTGAINFKSGTNTTVSGSGNDITIAATDTTYESKTASSGGTDVSLVTTGEKYTWNNKSDLAIGTTATTAAAGNHTHTTSLASNTGTSTVSLSANSKYKLTAGGTSVIFTTPVDADHITTATTSGSGNAVTAISADASGALTVTKGTTFLTGHQTIKQDGVTGATVNRFGTCSTGASTAAKTVSITTGTFALEAGSMVAVKFSNANTAGTPTLNVGSTGAKNIFVNGAQITTGDNKGLLTGTVIFIYDGTQYHIIGNYIDTNTQTVTGVKGDSESTYRTGNVNLTAANIGAAASSHTHSYAGSGSAGGPATCVAVTTTAPTANNTSGLKIAYLTSDPATKYTGWLYLIAES